MIRQIRKENSRVLSQSGQALAELAIFSAIFLYALSLFMQYGLIANFEQEEQMTTFRRALARASEVSQTSRVASVASLRDRQFPDARDAHGINERNSLSSQASVTWSNALLATYTDRNPRDLPRIIYVVNNEEKEFTTAGFKEIPAGTWCMYKHDGGSGCSKSSIRMKNYSGDSWSYGEPIVMYGWTESHGIGGSDWKPRQSDDEGDASDGYTYQRVLDLEGKYADVDYDNKDELIVKQYEAVENRWDADTKRRVYVSGIAYMDFQAGEVDLTINERDMAAGKQAQGLRPDYVRELSTNRDGTYFAREENTLAARDSIATTTALDTQDTITRDLVTNSGAEEIVSEFPTKKITTWTTPNY
ncbi:MAG: hypothetical protein AB1629_04950 [Candidatus Omnitrophota bacterium]